MQQKKQTKSSERGSSIVEVVLALLIIAILSSVAAMYVMAPKKYKAEDQALAVIDLMREAQQKALSEKKTMRFVIDNTNRQMQIIDENEPTFVGGVIQPTTAANDLVVKTIPYLSEFVYVGLDPSNMFDVPTEATPVSPIEFTGNRAVLRFKPNGSVHNAGNNAVGDNSAPTGRIIYVYSVNEADQWQNMFFGDVIRAVTVIGSSGKSRLRKCPVYYPYGPTSGRCENWEE